MTSWCDKLASTPSVGIGFEPAYLPSASALGSIASLLNEWTTKKVEAFSLTKQEAFGFQLHRNEGFLYIFEPARMTIEFRHRVKLRPVIGSNPELEILSKPEPYTLLLPAVETALIKFYGLIDPKGTRRLNRIGVVSTTIVNRSDVPPGITKFISRGAQPWPRGVESFNYSITGVINVADAYTDRCIHQIQQDPEQEEILHIVLDYQRIYKNPAPTLSDKLAQMIPEVRGDALAYFEQVAEGSLFDDHA